MQHIVVRMLIVLNCVLLAVATGQGQSVWTQQLPLQPIHHLNSVDFIDVNTGMAVGYLGAIVRTSDGGTTWTTLKSGTKERLVAAKMANAMVAIAVGDSGALLSTTDGGNTWSVERIPGTATFRDVAFSDHQTAIAVGYRFNNGTSTGLILRTTDAGGTWTEQVIVPTMPMRGVDFANARIGVAVGDSGTILRSTDGGVSWVPGMSETDKHLIDVAFADDTTAMISAGYRGELLWSYDAGDSWVSRRLSDEPYFFAPLPTITFADTRHGILLTPYSFENIFRTTDGGATWSRHRVESDDEIRSVCLVDSLRGFAVGDRGNTFRTTDGGVSWTSQRKALVADLHGVSFSDPYNGIAVGESGVILRTTNTGRTWVRENSGTSETLWSVFFTDTNLGTAVGSSGNVLRKSGNSPNWTRRIPVHHHDLFLDVSFVDDSLGFAVGGDGGMEVSTRSSFWRTTDGGSTWNMAENGLDYCCVMRKVRFYDEMNGVVVLANGQLFYTTNGGKKWLPRTFIMPDFYVTDCFLMRPSIAYVVGTDGVIARTGDLGYTWEIQNSSTKNTLTAIDFVDDKNGIAVGERGSIVRTTDGGQSWIPEISITDHDLLDVDFTSLTTATVVGGLGTILHAAFTNIPSGVADDVIAPSGDQVLGGSDNVCVHGGIFSLYPNPVDEALTIEFEECTENVNLVVSDNVPNDSRATTIEVYDYLHNLVCSLVHQPSHLGMQRVTFATNALVNGFYYCRVRHADAIRTKPFLVSR